MSETAPDEETEPVEPTVTDVPEPDQPSDEEVAEEEAHEAETGAAEPAEASAPRDDKEIEKAQKALEKENTRHKNRVSEIMGEDAQGLVPCPRCFGLADGLVFPFEVAPLDNIQADAVLASIGMGAEAAPPLREAEGVEMCSRCDGWGELTYPTRNPHVKTQMCPKCSGQGYVGTEQPAQVYSFDPAAFPSGVAAQSGGWNGGLPDKWNRPIGHPHYGRDPASVGV